MSQDIFDDIDPASTSGEELAALLNDFKDAFASGLSGTSRPANLQAGGTWVDTTNEGSPTFTWLIKMWDGTNDITLFQVNISTNTITLTGSDASFTVTKISADTAGALLQLLKKRIANNGQVLNGDTLGELRYVGTDDTGASVVAARIRAVTSDDFTGSASGAYLVFEGTVDSSAALVEMARIVDSKFGIGITAPLFTIHARGTGVATDRLADDAVAAKFISRKKRITGTGATQNNDLIGGWDVFSTDDGGLYIQTAALKLKATQAHTSAVGGTQWSFEVCKTGSVTLTEKFVIGDTIFLREAVSIEGIVLEQQDVATATSIAALSASKSIVAFTGATATALQGIDATGNAKVIVLHNKSSVTITVKHDDSGASAANRFSLPSSQDVLISPRSSMEVFYSSESRWKVKSGSGSGSGGFIVTDTEEAVASGAAITTTTTDQSQLRYVKSSVSGGGDTSTTPFGVGGGWIDGTKIVCIGTSDADPLRIVANDASEGAIGNFSEIVISKGVVASFIRSNSRSRWYGYYGS